MRKKRQSSPFQVDQLEIRQLLSAVVYVSASAPTGGTGTSWAKAFQTLQSGFAAAALVATSSNPVVIKV